jgi:NADH-quinone oxidoreductase subunit I
MEVVDAMIKVDKNVSDKNGKGNTYWKDIGESVSTLWTGLKLTMAHLFKAPKRWLPIGVKEKDYFSKNEGSFTVRFPHESFPVPENGRYKLNNEIEDCIVCDKCANICPVDCIEIESVRSPKEFGKTSDGTPRKIYAARFDIDMAKCCFCGLCTTVCPTECLTMTEEYDFSVFDVRNHIYSFANLKPEEIRLRKKEWEEYENSQPAPGTARPAPAPGAKPVFKPRIKIPGSTKPNSEGNKDAPQQPQSDQDEKEKNS